MANKRNGRDDDDDDDGGDDDDGRIPGSLEYQEQTENILVRGFFGCFDRKIHPWSLIKGAGACCSSNFHPFPLS